MPHVLITRRDGAGETAVGVRRLRDGAALWACCARGEAGVALALVAAVQWCAVEGHTIVTPGGELVRAILPPQIPLLPPDARARPQLLVLGPPGTPPAVHLEGGSRAQLRDAIERALQAAEELGREVGLCAADGTRLSVEEAVARAWRRRAG